MRKFILLAAVSGAIVTGAPAHADAGDILIKARGTYHKRLDSFSVTLPDTDLPVDADVKDAAGAEASLTMFLTNHIAMELSLGGAGYQVSDDTDRGLVSANLLMSTATVQYHFSPKGELFRPYVGAGITHLNLYGEDVEVVLLESAPDPFVSYNSRLTGGFAPVGQVGADIAINEQVYLNLDVKYTTRKTEILIEREARATDARRMGAVIVAAGIGFRF